MSEIRNWEKEFENESAFTKCLCDELKSLGALVFVMHGDAIASGLPDRLVVHQRWTGFIEFKALHTQIRENQHKVLADCCRRGFPAVVVRRSDPARRGTATLGELIQVTRPEIVAGQRWRSLGFFKDARELLDMLETFCNPLHVKSTTILP